MEKFQASSAEALVVTVHTEKDKTPNAKTNVKNLLDLICSSYPAYTRACARFFKSKYGFGFGKILSEKSCRSC
jgi:hypothetical protein